MQALRVAAAGFIVPYMAIYSPALMLQAGRGVDPWSAVFMATVAYVTIKAALGIGLLGVASIGYLARPTPLWERALALAASAMLIVAAYEGALLQARVAGNVNAMADTCAALVSMIRPQLRYRP